MISEDDFLWKCALQVEQASTLDDRSWIVPEYEDDMSHFGAQLALDDSNICLDIRTEYLDAKVSSSWLNSSSESDEIKVSIIESRGNGVLDVIGGELWEASLLLCAYIVLNIDKFYGNRVLELGSGVGLPGLLLGKLMSKQLRHHRNVGTSFPGDAMGITMSDNDSRVLAALCDAVRQQFNILPEAGPDIAVDLAGDRSQKPSQGEGINLKVVKLDWVQFLVTSTQIDRDEDIQADITQTADSRNEKSIHDVDIIIGSALCYARHHAEALAALIR